MEYQITGRQPEKLFHFFEEISAIPRGSGNEKGISDYLVAFAKERGLWVHQDEAWNVIIKKAGSPGAEDREPVMLQGHMDMVCEKLAGVEHDFEKEGLKLVVKDGVLSAEGTTLGADNGVAVALMLMALDDGELTHPPLECVFTTSEETGLDGAVALDKSLLQSRIMINMDSEEEGVGTVSCAGGLRVQMQRPVVREQAKGTLLRLAVSGLRGGHSGTDIDQERQNANRLLARMLWRMRKETACRLVSFDGGNKDNAIPREGSAVLLYSDASEARKGEELARQLVKTLEEEIHPCEEGFACGIDIEADAAAAVLPDDAAADLIRAVCLAPNGVQTRNILADGFVVSSVNLGIVGTEEDQIFLVFSPRSSVASLQEEMKARLGILAETFGFSMSFSGEYPGWSYQPESRIRDVFRESYRELFGGEMKMEAIHAGLECGLFCAAIPGLDAIAVGPTLENVHTPEEKLPLDSFERFYLLLKAVLERLAKA